MKVVRLKILTTYNCTLRCTYCFEHRQDIGSDLTYDELVKGIEKAKPYLYNKMQIMFFGGEPLMNFEMCQKSCDILGQNYRYFLYTNGTFFNQKYIDFIKNNHIRLIVSFDGVGSGNDLRKFPNGQSCDKIILKNIKKYIDNDIIPMVDMCIHDTSIPTLFDSIKALSDIGVKKIEFRAAEDYITDLNAYEEQLKLITKFYIDRLGTEKALIIDPPFESAYRIKDGDDHRWIHTAKDTCNLELHPGGKLKFIPTVMTMKYKEYEKIGEVL